MNEIVESNIPVNPETNIATIPAAAAPKRELTPGWKTTEFWMTVLGQTGLVLAASSGALPSRYAAIAGAFSQVAYNLSRGISKVNASR